MLHTLYIIYTHYTLYIYSSVIYIWSILWTKRCWSYQLFSKRKLAHTLNYNLCFMFYMFLMFHRGFAVRLGAGGCFIDVIMYWNTHICNICSKTCIPMMWYFCFMSFYVYRFVRFCCVQKTMRRRTKTRWTKRTNRECGKLGRHESQEAHMGPQPPRISIGLQM
jgi:hypothetical protein